MRRILLQKVEGGTYRTQAEFVFNSDAPLSEQQVTSYTVEEGATYKTPVQIREEINDFMKLPW